MYRIVAIALSLFLCTTASANWRDKHPSLNLEVLSTYQTGIFDESAAEIVAHDPHTQRLFVVNAEDGSVDVLDISDPTSIHKFGVIAAPGVNSVAVKKGIVAIALEATVKQDPGHVAFYDAESLQLINQVEVGALPDMVTFTPNGQYVLTANEGEPNDDYTVDPEGSISIIKISRGAKRATVRTANFRRFNKDRLLKKGVRIFGPDATVAQDIEPEYIAVSKNSKFAWVTLQENNAMALVDIRRAKVRKVMPLGFKNHDILGNGIDASNRDDAINDGINIDNYPVLGMYQPDSIASYTYRGKTFLVTANEGDSRDYDPGFSEEKRVKDLNLDPTAFPNAATLQLDENLGRLKTTTALGDTDGDGDFDKIYAYGSRSFSIWSARGKQVYDSGSEFETKTEELLPDYFNSNNDDNDSFDSRSDDKGPEPEGLAIGKIKGRTYAFIGLERVGGIMVYDITRPHAARFVHYTNNRDFTVDADTPEAGDLGPEGLLFIPAKKSPNRKPLLVVGNEVSGTTTVFQINLSR